MVALVEHAKQDLAFDLGALHAAVDFDAFLDAGRVEGCISLPVPGIEGEDFWRGGEGFHQD